MSETAYLVGDVLRNNLRVVFCGTALGHTSARTKAYYAHPRNLFWSVLHEAGFTAGDDPPLTPTEYHRVLDYGIGLTDLCKFAFGNDDQLPRGAFDKEALRHKILLYRPGVLAFTSKTAGRAFCGSNAELGWQTSRIDGTRIYILPSTSPSARWQWADSKAHWELLANSV